MAEANSSENGGNPKTTYISLPLLNLSSERGFPGDLYLCLRHKMVKYRNKGDKVSADDFNKLVFNHVRYVFLNEHERVEWEQWVENAEEFDAKFNPEAVRVAESSEAKPIVEAVKEQRRAMMDVFEGPREDRQVKAAIDTSRKLVTEFLRKPFAINNIQALQKYGKGTIDHAVNVSVLSVFLGLRLGYSHQIILENLAIGGLFHDVGKIMIEPTNEGVTEEDEATMQKHPLLGQNLLEKVREVQNEVLMIVAQHHEFLDGTGYPAKLRGLAIYDLARLVGIANLYDGFISQSVLPTLKERAAEALDRLENDYEGRLDPRKLEKVLKILRYSFV